MTKNVILIPYNNTIPLPLIFYHPQLPILPITTLQTIIQHILYAKVQKCKSLRQVGFDDILTGK